MAEITSYPTASPQGGDYLLGAQVGQPGDNPANPTKKFTVASVLAVNGGAPIVQRVQKVITSAELLSLNNYPTNIELVPNPGPNKAIVALNAAFKQDWGGVPYDFNQDLVFLYVNPMGNTVAGNIPPQLLNSGPNDQYAVEDLPQQPGTPVNFIKIDSSFAIGNNPGTSVTQGTGELVIDLLYRIVEFPS